jgi:hypothetical protein
MSNQEATMSVTIGRLLRNVLIADILFSSSGGLLMAAGAPFLSQFLNLPSTLLTGAGLALIPWVVALVVVVRRHRVSMMAIIGIVAINIIWGCVSFVLLGSDRIDPNELGIAFIAAQAGAVTVLAALQLLGLRRSAVEVHLSVATTAPQ